VETSETEQEEGRRLDEKIKQIMYREVWGTSLLLGNNPVSLPTYRTEGTRERGGENIGESKGERKQAK